MSFSINLTDPENPLPYEIQREEFLPAVRMMFISAHLKGMIDDWEKANGKTIPGELLHQSYNSACAIADGYKQQYGSDDRIFHTIQHARLQFRFDDEDFLLLKRLHSAIPSESAAYEQETVNIARMLNPIKARMWRNQDRHDCLYYFANSASEQKKLLYKYRSNPENTLDKIVRGDTSTEKLNFSDHIPGSKTSVAELAAICMFPDSNGSYQKNRCFVGKGTPDTSPKGLNEFASAVFAITMENQLRGNRLAADEVLATCSALAATIPFEDPNHLDNIAANIYKFLGDDSRSDLRTALGVANDDRKLRVLIDTIVGEAGRLANRDVGNFAGIHDLGDETIKKDNAMALYHGDNAVLRENKGTAFDATDPVQQFNFAYEAYSQHLSAGERQRLDSSIQDNGFIYGFAKNIYHNFKAELSNDSKLGIHHEQFKITGAEQLYQRYLSNRAIANEEHKRDMVFAAIRMAAAIKGEPFEAIKDRKQISPEILNAFFEAGAGRACCCTGCCCACQRKRDRSERCNK